VSERENNVCEFHKNVLETSERESQNVLALIEEIIKMSDEEFHVLCMEALREYGEPVMKKLRMMRYETKMLQLNRKNAISCGHSCGLEVQNTAF